MKAPIVIDLETEAIAPRPEYPPKPVGVAIYEEGHDPYYLAFGHPARNNAQRGDVMKILQRVWASDRPLLFHNARFDLDVIETHFDLKLPPWERIHDTLYLLFLADPHALSLSLKPAAERWLDMPPDERDAVRDWLVDHKVIAANQNPGPFIAKAPGDVVGPYAIGDVVRTRKLFERLHAAIIEHGMGGAYDRERRLMPILLRNEREGVPVDVPALEHDLRIYNNALNGADAWLRLTLGNLGLNLDADADVADALEKAGVVREFAKTKTGRRSVAKKNLTKDRFTDPRVWQALGYRNRLQTVLSMNIRPWLEQATANKGRIFTEWNQVRQAHGNDGAKGTRTGRLSCSRLMNITKDFTDKGDGYEHPDFLEVPELPLVRRYVTAGKGKLFGHLDYKQQEFRILAHFAEGELLRKYNEDPDFDKHVDLQRALKELGHDLPRRPVKILGFGKLYGMGVVRFAEALHEPVEKVRSILKAMDAAEPEVRQLIMNIKYAATRGEPIHTWGGRLYYCEEPRRIESGPRKGEMQTFEYKLLNYLIQGSAADCTKEAIIRYDAARKESRLLVTVHDEINIAVPKKALHQEMAILREAMESIEFDVPMLTDAEVGPSWGELEPYTYPKRRAA